MASDSKAAELKSVAKATAKEHNTSRFKGQIVVITGAAQGIGFGIARRFGSEGATVILVDVNQAQLDKAVKALSQEGITASAHELNVTVEESVNKVFKAIVEAHGKVDVLVQSAGITGKTGIKMHEVELRDFMAVINVNLTGIFLCCKAVLPHMLSKNYGRIVNIASVAGKEGNAGMLAYSSSKAGVVGLTKVIGKDYAETGITCNAVAPAVVRTAMVDALPAKQVDYMTEKIPMKRCGSIEEIAAVVAFIASPEASFTTGFTFDATGGRATY